MERKIPDNLIFSNSNLNISYEENSSINNTQSAIIISGTRNGFLSFANILLFYSNDLEELIPLADLSFVNSTIDLTIQTGINARSENGDVFLSNQKKFLWLVNETDLDHIAALIHSLGHINNELHFDSGKSVNDISVYCVVEWYSSNREGKYGY